MNGALVASALAALLVGSDAFAPSASSSRSFVASPTKNAGGRAFSSSAVLAVKEADEDPVTITATGGDGKKEIGYDEKKGRFYETGMDEVECIPDDEYCAVDKSTGNLVRLTVKEKERIFLDALQSYYATGRQILDDAEFDTLKEDLSWNGSPVVALKREETRFLQALQAYNKGEPIMSDTEFDALKTQLKEEKSPIAVSTEPKCYIDSGICRVTFEPDNFRNNLLYLPVGAILSIVWLGLGFEFIEPLIRINPIILLALGAYPIYKYTAQLTDDYIFTNNKIAYGPCPSCETETRVYFGNILGVEGFNDVAEIKCTKCKSIIEVQKNTLRASTLPK
eukprot:CAMPEP_0197438084 /NCGR_PEP_ID=MMETSP1175-20131217/5177_1 /TAXON_ID=1003142 /ORGANISM="Triceratium dubium, Strain CCMP147" /LENGTH=336 /DNA_ID=CAMNT_0042967747 /DNA_START=96 /DNA_END=1106 /DNA_ORIENTATION=+